jgi:hypothetical protein
MGKPKIDFSDSVAVCKLYLEAEKGRRQGLTLLTTVTAERDQAVSLTNDMANQRSKEDRAELLTDWLEYRRPDQFHGIVLVWAGFERREEARLKQFIVRSAHPQ